MIFSSCERSTLKFIEQELNVKLGDKISFCERKEQWDGFQGNGYYVETYNIKVDYLEELVTASQKENFLHFDKKNRGDVLNYPNILDYPDIIEYTQGEGYYKCRISNNEIILITINIVTMKIIYYQVLF